MSPCFYECVLSIFTLISNQSKLENFTNNLLLFSFFLLFFQTKICMAHEFFRIFYKEILCLEKPRYCQSQKLNRIRLVRTVVLLCRRSPKISNSIRHKRLSRKHNQIRDTSSNKSIINSLCNILHTIHSLILMLRPLQPKFLILFRIKQLMFRWVRHYYIVSFYFYFTFYYFCVVCSVAMFYKKEMK